jgi:integrase
MGFLSMDTSVYDMKDNIRGEMARLEKAEISESAKESIKEFLDSVSAKEVTTHRIYFYAVRLRLLASFMGDDFLDPNVKNVTRLIMSLKNSESRRGSSYSANTMNDFKIALKRFYMWKFKSLEPEISDLLKKRESKANKRSEDIISQAEVREIISHANSPRDKFLIALAYDSGCRISEILTLRIRDVSIDEYGIRLHVTGKTGERNVRCVGDSVVLFSDWVARHPQRSNPDSYLFVKFDSGMFKGGDALDYDSAQKVLQNALSRSGITRRIHWHLFRHTRATLLARDVKEAPLERQMGWVHGSKQTQTYVHLTDKDVDNSILKAYGVEIKEKDHVKIDDLPRVCERCGTINTSDAKYCKRCALPLDKSILNELDQKESKAIEILGNLELDPIEQKLLEMIKSNPDLKEQLLLEILRLRREKS